MLGSRGDVKENPEVAPATSADKERGLAGARRGYTVHSRGRTMTNEQQGYSLDATTPKQ